MCSEEVGAWRGSPCICPLALQPRVGELAGRPASLLLHSFARLLVMTGILMGNFSDHHS